jgi:hypothetical protein
LSNEKEPPPKDVFTALMEIDMNAMKRETPMSPTAQELAASMREDLVYENYREQQEWKDLKREERKLEMEEKKKALEEKKPKIEGTTKKDPKDAPLTKFMEGFTNPQWLAMWGTLSKEAQQMLVQGAFQAQATWESARALDTKARPWHEFTKAITHDEIRVYV